MNNITSNIPQIPIIRKLNKPINHGSTSSLRNGTVKSYCNCDVDGITGDVAVDADRRGIDDADDDDVDDGNDVEDGIKSEEELCKSEEDCEAACRAEEDDNNIDEDAVGGTFDDVDAIVDINKGVFSLLFNTSLCII